MTPSAMERPILDSVAASVGRLGGSNALEDGVRTLTFDAMWREVAGLANAMLALEVPDGPVGVLLRGDVGSGVALLACLAVGRPAVPVDPAMPRERIDALMEQVGVTLMLLGQDGPDIGRAGVPRLRVKLDAGPGVTMPRQPLGLDVPALILCTSGSTGRPKAIVHSQRTMLSRASRHMNGAGARAGELCLSLSPPSTMSGAVAVLSCAVAGVGLRFLDLRKEGIAGLIEVLTQRPVRMLRAAPSALRLIAALPDARRILSGVRSVTLISEPVLRADVATIRDCLPEQATLFSNYGSTESGSIAWYPSGDDAYDPVRTPAGWLMPGTDAVIVDDEGRPCEVEETGELVLRSRTNALGEWLDGRCVPGALVADAGDASVRVHRTGDVAWRTVDDVFVVLGRKDRMMKVNGQRIEPAEIEAAVRACDAVVECSVVPQVRGPAAVQSIVAFITLQAGAGADAVETLRASLRTRLPAGMLPSRIVVLDAMPLLPGGKADLVALKAMAAGGSAIAAAK